MNIFRLRRFIFRHRCFLVVRKPKVLQYFMEYTNGKLNSIDPHIHIHIAHTHSVMVKKMRKEICGKTKKMSCCFWQHVQSSTARTQKRILSNSVRSILSSFLFFLSLSSHFYWWKRKI